MLGNVEEKQKELRKAGEFLKSRYFGINHIIDQIISSIETWWCYDEILYKPTICNLFGMTGCGKTSLVEDLAKLLSMYEKYVKIDLSKPPESNHNYSRYYNGGPITNKIYSIVNDTDEPAIVLIDELQKVKDNHSNSELWTLLSDGKLGSGHVAIVKIDGIIRNLTGVIEDYNDYVQENEYMNRNSNNDKNNRNGNNSFGYTSCGAGGWNPMTQPIPLNRKYLLSNLYEAKNNKLKTLDDLEPLFDFHDYTSNKTGFRFGYRYTAKRMIEESEGKVTIKDILETPGFAYVQPLIQIAQNYRKCLIEKYNKVSSRDPLVFSKLLIFVTGNVDGLYQDSNNINISSKELYDKTMKFTIKDLKEELIKIFKPDELARLGGNFIIYPSLSPEAFDKIIEGVLKQVEIDITNLTDIKIDLSYKPYFDYLVKSCVVASLGARPTISKLYTEINNVIPKLVMKAKKDNLKEISIVSIMDEIIPPKE